MEDIGLKRLSELIYVTCGIDYRKNLQSLASKVEPRIKATGLSYWEYAGYIILEKSEWDPLVELITVNETYFFREEHLLAEFERVLTEDYLSATAEQPLTIWCAACSTGEEPYTLSMIVEKTGLFEEGAVKIMASDINKKVLDKAREGLYHKKSFSFRRMPEGAIDAFFEEEGDFYKVRECIRNRVSFYYHNLMGDPYQNEFITPDILFCRNVLIYFDHDAVQSIINQFYDFIKPRGYLFLGHSEALTHYEHHFETIYTEHTFYYKKGGYKSWNK